MRAKHEIPHDVASFLLVIAYVLAMRFLLPTNFYFFRSNLLRSSL